MTGTPAFLGGGPEAVGAPPGGRAPDGAPVADGAGNVASRWVPPGGDAGHDGTVTAPGAGRTGRWRPGTAGRLAAFHAAILLTVLGVVVVALVRQFSTGYESVATQDLVQELRAYGTAMARSAPGQDLVSATVTYLQGRSLPAGTVIVVALPGPRVLTTPGANALRHDPRVLRWLTVPPQTSAVLTTAVGTEPVQLLAAPVRRGTQPIGTFVAATDLSAPRAQAARVLRLSLAEAAVALVAGVLSSYLLLRRLLRTVGEITTTAEMIGRGELDRRIGDGGSDDEVGRLGTTFDAMLDRLDGAMSAQRRLLSDVSHQLRTPLTVARGHLEVLRRTGGLAGAADSAGDTVDLVMDELDHMRRLVERLLLLGRALEPDFLAVEPIDLRSFLADLDAAATALGDRRWALAPVPDLVVQADPAKLRGALLNLVENAVHATDPGDAVAMAATVDVDTGALRISVEDSGPGIPVALRAEALTRFSRPGARGEGSGLGLAIVKAVAEAHGGLVDIGTSTLGGARISIVLPAALCDGGAVR